MAGWVSSTFGARWGLVLGAVACFAAAAVGAASLRQSVTAPGRRLTQPLVWASRADVGYFCDRVRFTC